MEVICLHDEAFYALLDEVVDRLKQEHGLTHDPWVSPKRAMELLNIKSRTTLQNLRDTGAIAYTQPQPRIILYSYDSIMEYLEQHKQNTF